MQKIFGPNYVEIKDFFQCLWCKEVLHCITRTGTAPLTRHIGGCKKRPLGYVLPTKNMHLERRKLDKAAKLAETLSKLMEIAILHGTVSAQEFSTILPADGEAW